MRSKVLVFATALGVVLLSAALPGRAASVRGPGAIEQRWMQRLLLRLGEHEALLPLPVVNTLNSLTRTVSWNFSCPPSTRFKEVEVQVSTKHVAWDPSRLRSRRAAGGYAWNTKLEALAGRAKVRADNWLMLDPDYLTRQETRNGDEGLVEAEVTLYHELLHGEILILAMATPEWQRKTCNKLLDLYHFAPSHEKIEPLAEEYGRRLRDRFVKKEASLEAPGPHASHALPAPSAGQ